MFNLKSNEYQGEGLTMLLQKAIGSDKYERYMISQQDPLCGDATSGDVRIITNPEETNPERMEYATIGTVYEVG